MTAGSIAFYGAHALIWLTVLAILWANRGRTEGQDICPCCKLPERQCPDFWRP